MNQYKRLEAAYRLAKERGITLKEAESELDKMINEMGEKYGSERNATRKNIPIEVS